MEKLLTISVAAYNVEEYIRQNLDSIVSSEYIDLIEVFVIDDGGKDNTLEIANEYQRKYPNSIIPVHKDNGGYGTTVNYSVEHATGKYIRLLDGDDWLDTKGLNSLMEFLKNEEDVDWIITDVEKHYEDGRTIVKSAANKYGKCIRNVKDIDGELAVGMWHSTFRTALVKEHIRPFPSRYLYTDILFMTYPIPFVEKIGFIPETLYCYRLGRFGQSISKESRNKHYKEYIDLVDIVKEYYYENNGNSLPEVIQKRFFTFYKYQVLNLLLLPPSKENKKAIVDIERITKEKYREFYDFGKESKKIRLLRATRYMTYWPIARFLDNNW